MSSVAELVTDKKFCRKCDKIKDINEFGKYRGIKSTAHKLCLDCRSKIKSEKNKHYLEKVRSDPERHARLLANKKAFNSSVKYYDKYFTKRFGITYNEVRAMFDAQFGKCSNRACGKELYFYNENTERRNHPNSACVDHDHKTGKVRALLCMPCNTILGTLETKGNIVLGLMEYKTKHNYKE